jgi:acyl-CoA thioester hydrolase
MKDPNHPPLLFHDHRVRVIYRDTDQMGVVYYANYFGWMEAARTEYLRARGWTYHQMEKSGLLLPVIHAACDYKSPARYDDIVVIRATVSELTRVRLEFHYEIRVEGREGLTSIGITRHIFTGPDWKPRRASEEVLRCLRGEGPPPP